MQYKIIRMIFLLMTVSLISSTTTGGGSNKKARLLKGSFAPIQKGKGCTMEKTCSKKCNRPPAIKSKGTEKTAEATTDFYLPVSPVSRFILLKSNLFI